MARRDVIKALCEISQAYYTQGNRSVLDLMVASGYQSEATFPSEAELEVYLWSHPELIEAWYAFSGDQRYYPAWYLYKPQDTKTAHWSVGRYPDIPEVPYPDGSRACAAFVARTLQAFDQMLREREEERKEPKHRNRKSRRSTDSRIYSESPTLRIVVKSQDS